PGWVATTPVVVGVVAAPRPTRKPTSTVFALSQVTVIRVTTIRSGAVALTIAVSVCAAVYAASMQTTAGIDVAATETGSGFAADTDRSVSPVSSQRIAPPVIVESTSPSVYSVPAVPPVTRSAPVELIDNGT